MRIARLSAHIRWSDLITTGNRFTILSFNVYSLTLTVRCCATFRGSSNVGLFAVDEYGTQHYGVTRGCGTAKEHKCFSESGLSIPEIGVTTATVTVCYCAGDLCNLSLLDHRTTTPNIAGHQPLTPAASGDGRVMVSFNVASLLALAAARFLSQ